MVDAGLLTDVLTAENLSTAFGQSIALDVIDGRYFARRTRSRAAHRRRLMTEPIPLRPAARRDGDAGAATPADGIKVFLMRRHRGDGVRRRRDGVPRRRGRRPRPQRRHRLARPRHVWWAERLGIDADLAEALVCAAARETFEESGVLFAGAADDPDLLVDDASVYRDAAGRAGRATRCRSASSCAREKLVLRADLLRPWANWVTPKEERTRRYDTYFFVGALPEGQRADGENTETDQADWITPQAALDDFAAQRSLPAAADLDAARLAGRPHRRRGARRRTPDRRRARRT